MGDHRAFRRILTTVPGILTGVTLAAGAAVVMTVVRAPEPLLSEASKPQVGTDVGTLEMTQTTQDRSPEMARLAAPAIRDRVQAPGLVPTPSRPRAVQVDADPIVITVSKATEATPRARPRPTAVTGETVQLAVAHVKPRPRPANLTTGRDTADPVLTASVKPRPRPATLSRSIALAKAEPATKPAAKPKAKQPGNPRFAGSAKGCSAKLARAIPRRKSNALGGAAVMRSVMSLGGADRDRAVARQVLAGNVPDFMRTLTPVRFAGTAGGKPVEVVICVTPEYVSVGSNRDFVRVPLGLPAAAQIADRFGFMLPTTKMVDAIYAQADVRLAPSPMTPGAKMTTTSYMVAHNSTVDRMRARSRDGIDALTAGQKKDVVLSTRLRSAPGRVAIYGWHRTNGRPIQPLSTVHGARYADYSHGVRLVSQTAFVNGKPVALERIMEDPQLAGLVSKEGPISNPVRLQASLIR